jgi:hypothetical protein
LHLDPERKGEPFAALPRVRVLHGLPGAAPTKETVTLQWKSADLLEATIAIAGRETILNTVEISGQPPVTLPAACLPYSPEFTPDQPGRGAATLAQIAMTTGGRERVEIPKIWSELPIKSRYVELAPWLLVLGAILFLLEILERRTGWVSKLFGRKAVVKTESSEAEIAETKPAAKTAFPWLISKPARVTKSAAPQTKPAPPTAISTAAPKPAAEKPVSADSAIDALRKARERAKNRTDKGG